MENYTTHNDKNTFLISIKKLEKRKNKIKFRKYFKDLTKESFDILYLILTSLINNYKNNNIYKIPLENRNLYLTKIFENIKIHYKIIINKNIPYLGGYSLENKNLYVDKNFYKEITEYQFKLIILHEYIERTLLNNLLDFNYFLAHQIAQQIEYSFYKIEEENELQQIVDDFEQITLKKFESSKIIIPLDLDETGYKDCGDLILLQKCKKFSFEKEKKTNKQNFVFKSKIG